MRVTVCRLAVPLVALATACATLLVADPPAVASQSPSAVGRASAGRAVPVIVAAGDISCAGVCAPAHATARLIRRVRPRAVLTLGDNQYPSGTLFQYRSFYADHWGKFHGKTYPVPGNHEYETPGAAGFFAYFSRRLPGTRGWYSYNLGSWHLIALNSRKGETPSWRQLAWLRRDLLQDSHRCQLAYWHHPRFSSGTSHGSDRDMTPFWAILQTAGVDVVLNGHEHNYERFAKMLPSGRPASSGIRQFVAGTGGASLHGFGPPRRGSQTRVKAFGVLRMALEPDRYRWSFITTADRVADRGSNSCH